MKEAFFALSEEEIFKYYEIFKKTLSGGIGKNLHNLEYSIRDEGEGMTEQELSACRDPFFTTKQTGAGLGLPLCEQYIRENSGVMEIESVKNEYTLISLIFERSQPCFHES